MVVEEREFGRHDRDLVPNYAHPVIRARAALALIVTLGLASEGCSRPSNGSADRSEMVSLAAGANDRATLRGAGSTFAAPLLDELSRQYRRVAAAVNIEYRSSGSLSGIQALTSGTADFAASEVALTDEQKAGTEETSPLSQVPWIAGGIAVAFNLPGLRELRLSATTLAAIFAGRVERWDDPSIRRDNPGVGVPSSDINVIHRSDASGTTKIFTEFLQGAVPETWTLGSGTTIRWPRGRPATGSEGVLSAVEQTPGAVGYVAVGYTTRASLGIALIQNGAGRFVVPSAESVGAALSGANPESPGAYPITTVSYVIFSESGLDPAKEIAFRHFAGWVLSEGQRSAELLGYARLPLPLLVDGLRKVQQQDSARQISPARPGQ